MSQAKVKGTKKSSHNNDFGDLASKLRSQAWIWHVIFSSVRTGVWYLQEFVGIFCCHWTLHRWIPGSDAHKRQVNFWNHRGNRIRREKNSSRGYITCLVLFSYAIISHKQPAHKYTQSPHPMNTVLAVVYSSKPKAKGDESLDWSGTKVKPLFAFALCPTCLKIPRKETSSRCPACA